MDFSDFDDIQVLELEDLPVPDIQDIKIDHSMHAGHNMAMHFNTNLGITYLFEGITINSTQKLVIYFIFTIIMGILTELLKFYRIKMMVETGQKHFHQKLVYSMMYFAQITLAYFLMLIAMLCLPYLPEASRRGRQVWDTFPLVVSMWS